MSRWAAAEFAAAVITVALAVPALATSPPADFYTPPNSLPSGKPGTIIRAEPMTAYELPMLPMRARAWRILYRSTTATGQPTAVSGVVLVPTQPYPGQRPLIGYAIGTQGLADRCAPSHQLAAGTEYEAPVIGQVLAKGWAVAVTDYPGLGTPGDHTYVVGDALGRAVLDSMRAARRLKQAGIPANGPAAVMGYSEGGLAAAAAGELQPSYAQELHLAAIAIGGVPADITRDVAAVDGTPDGWWLSLYAAIGFNAAYPGLDLPRYLNALGRRYVTKFEDTCIEDALVDGTLAPSYHASDYFTHDIYASPAWLQRLSQNRLGRLAPAEPVLVQDAQNDEAVAYAPALTLYHAWCVLGVDAHFRTLVGEHFTGAVQYLQPAIDFIAARFAGVQDARAADCARHA